MPGADLAEENFVTSTAANTFAITHYPLAMIPLSIF